MTTEQLKQEATKKALKEFEDTDSEGLFYLIANLLVLVDKDVLERVSDLVRILDNRQV